MNREIKFIKRNSANFRNARKYIESLCYSNDLTGYEFKEYLNDEVALQVQAGDKFIIAYLDFESLEIKVVVDNNVVRAFTGDTGWSKTIKFIKEQIN